jgi:16S rRNA G966 N2-methylase RsmD
MIEELLASEVQDFIYSHEKDDERNLLLKHKSIHGIPTRDVIQQIVGRRKAKEKIPELYHTKGIIYPPKINIEQSSSEMTAGYKTTMIKSVVPEGYNRAVDLTGGFGIDTLYLSKIYSEVEYIDPNETLLAIAAHNHKVLHHVNIHYHACNAESFLTDTKEKADLIYIDPSRRKASTEKVFLFKDCEPNVTEIIDTIFNRTTHLLVKASPLLDLQKGISELKYVKRVSVVSVNNECKELLFFCAKGFLEDPVIDAVDLSKQDSIFSFSLSEERIQEVRISEPLTYLYEPNASILKAGAFKSIANRFGLQKMHANTHLYTSSQISHSFPGRIFEVESFTKPDNKTMMKYYPEMQANILLRNYPLTVEALKKKSSIKEGGEKYLIGFSGLKGKFLAVCSRIF